MQRWKNGEGLDKMRLSFRSSHAEMAILLFPFSEIIKRDCGGYAIGGLSGGEEKDQFWRMVHVSTEVLPRTKPRYLMGVG